MIEVNELTKRFGANLAVDRLDFAVQEGEILGFLGPNGAGKTTTMRILTGFFPPSSGRAKVGGFDVLEEPLAARGAVGYLPENVPLYQDMRVGEYLRFVAGAKGLGRVAAKRESERVMEATGITDRRGQLIKQLSKGYRQRVGLAQALTADPPVLILDEPTIGLDPQQIVEIRSLIKSFAGHKTVVLSSHILPEVAATCSQVVIINHGRVVAQGPISLLASGQEGGRALKVLVAGGEAQALDALRGVAGVKAAAAGEPAPAEGPLALRVETDGRPATQAEVAKRLVEAGLGLLELTPVSLSLEEVFVHLITEEPAGEEVAQ